MIDLRLLGAFEVRVNELDGIRAGLTQPKRLALLAYLALAEPAGLHSRDRLLALLWPDADDGSSRHSLRNALHALRQSLGDGAIETRGDSWVGLDHGALRCDVLAVRDHLSAGRLDEAMTLCSGDLMPGFHVSGAPDFDQWLEEQRHGLRQALRSAAWNRARQLEGAGASELDAVRRAIRLDPGNEPGARRLIRLLAAAGDRAGALEAFQDVVDWFARELEAEPSNETRALAEQLRVGDTTPPTVPPAALSPRTAPTGASPIARSVSTDAPRPKRHMPRMRRAGIMVGMVAAVALGGSVYLSRDEIRRAGPAAEAELAVLHLPMRYRDDTAAYSSFLRGLALRFQFRFTQSRDTLEALVERRPLYVPGLTGLAHAWIYTALNELTDPDDAWPRIDALARNALALDSTSASAWLALATEDMFARGDLARADERIIRARRLDAFDSDVAGMRSVWFRFRGEMDSAVAEARLAHRLDPLSLLQERLLAKQLFFARRYEESRQAYARMLQNAPGNARGYRDLAELSVAMGRRREAVQWLHLARTAQGDSAGAAALTSATTDRDALRLLSADARRTIARLDSAARAGQRVSASAYARAFAAVGDTIATLNWLDSMLMRRDSYKHQVRLDPAFDFVRREPRYWAWESRSALPPIAGSEAGARLGLQVTR